MPRSLIFRFGLIFALLLALLPATVAAQGFEPEYDDADYPIELAIGDEFVISLEANPSTGYQWELTGPLDGAILELVDVDHQRPVNPMPGAPGFVQFTVRAVGEGSTTVVFQYVRPWENNVPAARTASFVVNVAAASTPPAPPAPGESAPAEPEAGEPVVPDEPAPAAEPAA